MAHVQKLQSDAATHTASQSSMAIDSSQVTPHANVTTSSAQTEMCDDEQINIKIDSGPTIHHDGRYSHDKIIIDDDERAEALKSLSIDNVKLRERIVALEEHWYAIHILFI